MTKEQLERIKQAYYSGLKVQIWFNGYWEDFDVREYSMYPDPFSENRQYRIVGSAYADVAEKHITELEKAYGETEELLNKQIEATYKVVEENKELKTVKIPQLERRIASIRGCHSVDAKKLNARIEQVERLKQENAELKERANDADLDSVLFFNQLCKAKDIIKKLINTCCFYGATSRITAEAEQFLKEE